MGDPFAPLPPGASVTKISRTAQNALLAMLREWRAGRLAGTNRTARTVAEVLVRNDTYVTYPAFSIMGIGDPLISPFDGWSPRESAIRLFCPAFFSQATILGALTKRK